MSLKNGVLEGCLVDFGGPGGRFWRLRAQFFHDFRMFLAECAENLPRTCRGLAQLVDAYLRSLRFCGLAPLGRDLLRGGGAAVVPPRGFQLNPPHPAKDGWRVELFCTSAVPGGFWLCQGPCAFRRSHPKVRMKNDIGPFFQFFSIFWPSKKCFKICFEKITKKVRKSRFSASQNPPKIRRTAGSAQAC